MNPNMQPNKIIRNPSQDELKKLQQKDVVKGMPAPTNQVSTPVIISTGLKPSTTFEPKPIEFLLPSNKLIIPSGKIMVRRMTTVEEGMFQETLSKLSRSDEKISHRTYIYTFLDTINRAMNNCIKTDIDIYGLSLIDKTPLFLFVMSITYGDMHDVELQCSACKKDFTHTLDISTLKNKIVPENFQYPRIVELMSFPFKATAYLTYPTIGDEMLWVDNADPIAMYLSILSRIEGTTDNNEQIGEKHYEELVKNLHDDDKKKIKAFIAEFSEYGSDVVIEKNVCKDKMCGNYEKLQNVILPIRELFLSIFK